MVRVRLQALACGARAHTTQPAHSSCCRRGQYSRRGERPNSDLHAAPRASAAALPACFRHRSGTPGARYRRVLDVWLTGSCGQSPRHHTAHVVMKIIMLLLWARVERCALRRGLGRRACGIHPARAATACAATRGRICGPNVGLRGDRGGRPAGWRTLVAAPAQGEGGARRAHIIIGASGPGRGPYLVGSLRVAWHRVEAVAGGVNRVCVV